MCAMEFFALADATDGLNWVHVRIQLVQRDVKFLIHQRCPRAGHISAAHPVLDKLPATLPRLAQSAGDHRGRVICGLQELLDTGHKRFPQ